MSMLAERRQKQKWTVDPRNTAWSNDGSKFGQKMLEKMGWSKGKGLGAQEQGATEHIKVQVKNNHLGLGATINNEDNWIAHQDDFNQLLAELNTCHGQEATDFSDNKEKKSFNLEEKSKISKNRVHYMKFTKGKDLSSRSKMDLDCIFGKRQNKKTPEDNSSPTTPEENETSTTTTSALTIQEYFAKRLAELKNKPQITATDPDLSEARIEWKMGKKRNKEAKDKNLENNTQPKKEKPQEQEESPRYAAKKKRDQVEQQHRDPCCDENSEYSAENGKDCVWPPDDKDFTPKSKKMKEKKKLKKQVEASVDPMLDEMPVKKKKKTKKSSK
ncbi:PIN2/TERF1-interacting telomerase inhibitor 1 isoform X1 [Elephas maximus indicus]|uniref:PIN2/TERF1-interacting telomerase inhibitor 1 isoform X1 n=2 Tax=Elephas maximus indicus TaxID=99487 RepID=UPI0021165CBB|nr:PIN2/TERF1-interacting telomerase inhibitor 1 isoform X1 [Elephas maximus indicus]